MTKPVYFMHYRSFDEVDGKISGVGGATVAIFHDAEQKKAKLAIALCSKKDHFNRKIGRQIAEGRLVSYLNGRQNDHVMEIDIDETAILKDAVHGAIQEIMEEKELY